MNCLRCYTIDDEISAGIGVSGFESITTNNPDTTVVKTATIQTIPLLPDKIYHITRTFAAASQTCLSFINEAPKGAKESDAGVILAVDSKKWIPQSGNMLVSIIDPCGLHGLVLLFIRKNCEHALLSIKDPASTLSVDSKGLPKFTKTNRANLLLEALYASNQLGLSTLNEGSEEFKANVIV